MRIKFQRLICVSGASHERLLHADSAVVPAHLRFVWCPEGSFFILFFWVGQLFITYVKHTCSERTTRAIFSLCVDQQQAN